MFQDRGTPTVRSCLAKAPSRARRGVTKNSNPSPQKRVDMTERARGSLGTECKWRIVSLRYVKPFVVQVRPSKTCWPLNLYKLPKTPRNLSPYVINISWRYNYQTTKKRREPSRLDGRGWLCTKVDEYIRSSDLLPLWLTAGSLSPSSAPKLRMLSNGQLSWRATQASRACSRSPGGPTESISMFSRTIDTGIPDEGLLPKSAELKCSSRHSCPPSGSAARFSETANLRVNMGLRL